MSELLEIAAHTVTAILATWLGLVVVTRARRARGAAVFGALCAVLVVWSVAIIVQRTTSDPSLAAAVNLLEDVSAYLLPAATLHIAISIAYEGPRPPIVGAVLAFAYLLGVGASLQAWLDPARPIAFGPPHWEPLGVDGTTAAWLFLGARLVPWLTAVAVLASARRRAWPDRARRRQLSVAMATILLGVLGGVLRIGPREIVDEWVGVALVAAATALATYAVVAQHLFITTDAAERAVRWSVLAGLGIVAYVLLLGTVDRLASRFLAVELPIVMALGLVVTIAVADPVGRWLRLRLGPKHGAEVERLFAAMGLDPVLAQRPDRALTPAVERVVRALELSGALVIAADGRVLARVGSVDSDAAGALRLPMTDGDRTIGYAIFGARADGAAASGVEVSALHQAADFMAASLRLTERQDDQATRIAALRDEHAAVRSQGTALSAALARPADRQDGLHVYALGSLRVERDGQPIHRWGGEKAGSRQAEAIFAMLFDRGDQGAAKDELQEVVWPDADFDRADAAFHRTMLGLRAALRGDSRRGADRKSADLVVFHNDRYRLNPVTVAWSDVAEFDRLVATAASAEPAEALSLLERARALYRGDYLDDVPYFGDSAAVETRRVALRRAVRDLLLELASRYEARGERLAASACRRQADGLTADLDEPSAVESSVSGEGPARLATEPTG